MRNHLFYGEIVAKIAGTLSHNPDHKARITRVVEDNGEWGQTTWSLCAEAGRIFDRLEDISDLHDLNWPLALDHYSKSLLSYLLGGQKPRPVDLMSLAVNSIQHVRQRTGTG